MADIYRFIVQPWLMRAAFGAALVGTMALSPSSLAAAPKEEHLEQVGAYSKLENAATMVETLRVEGRNAFIRQKSVDGRTVFVVLVEPMLIKDKKPAPKPEPQKETPKPAQKPEQKPAPAKPATTPSGPKMETVIVTDTMPPAVPPPAPEKKAPVAPAPAASASVPEKKAPVAPEKKVPVALAPPAPVVLPVTRADATESIEVMSDADVYDRPFATGRLIGSYAEVGGAYVKEYLGWYAIKLPSGSSGFIRKEDAELINITVSGSSASPAR